MKIIHKLTLFPVCLLELFCLFGGSGTVLAQGTAITYQGRLNVGGVVANGNYDLAFTLYSASAGGVSLAGPVTNAAVRVTNGLFSTLVDFGNGYGNGTNWLELAVATNGGGVYTPLTPRQQFTPVPYALYAAAASNVLGAVSAAQLTGSLPPAVISGGTITSTMLAPGAVSVLGAPDGSPTNAVGWITQEMWG